ncbi:sensor histidine kinase [Caenibacillus caldisaponilyticus]|uniref:sensor histidine kinase n=1 Tax=Caenibacillus caldisaponilyticus TaxID=1674942 RepID=UPI000988676C|nr:sensor histidine kinase [Caenibacillus caldisaponilyticus]
MLKKLSKWNTLRNQILVVFLVVMVVVLSIVTAVTLRQVSDLIQKNAENQIRQTAVEASGRIDSLFEQLDTVTKFILTNQTIQDQFEREYKNKPVSFSELQKLGHIVNNILINSKGVYSVELYTKDLKQLLPVSNDPYMFDRIHPEWVREADQAKGNLVWIGKDPKNPDYCLAIRRINLINQDFNNAGYMISRVNNDYFSVMNADELDQYTILLDQKLEPIFSNYPGKINPLTLKNKSTTQIQDETYMVTKQSSKDGFVILILTPIQSLTKGLSGIRLGIILAGLAGIAIYFILSLFLSNFITKPIITLTNTMRLANEGLLATNPKTITVNEIKELNSTYNQLAKETNHLIKMVYQKEIIRSLNELKALQAQINPHFLYNTLDSLRWSLEEKGEEELADVVVAMSNLFRYTISKNSDDDWVALADEFNHIENYLDIIKFRFGDRIKWALSLPDTLQTVKIPKLLIQPLVENAVLHGSGNQLNPCTISVSATQVSDGQLKIIVQDDGAGIEENQLQAIKEALDTGSKISENGKGMALYNVKKRLDFYYSDQAENIFMIESKRNMGTKVTIEIPILRGELSCTKKRS